MSNLLLAIAIVATGTASQYGPHVMWRNIEIRQTPGRTAHDLPPTLPDVAGYVAVVDCDRIGSLVWLRPYGGEWERFLVADCAGVADGGRAWMQAGGVLVEVDYETAKRWDVVGRGAIVFWGVLVDTPGCEVQ